MTVMLEDAVCPYRFVAVAVMGLNPWVREILAEKELLVTVAGTPFTLTGQVALIEPITVIAPDELTKVRSEGEIMLIIMGGSKGN